MEAQGFQYPCHCSGVNLPVSVKLPCRAKRKRIDRTHMIDVASLPFQVRGSQSGRPSVFNSSTSLLKEFVAVINRRMHIILHSLPRPSSRVGSQLTGIALHTSDEGHSAGLRPCTGSKRSGVRHRTPGPPVSMTYRSAQKDTAANLNLAQSHPSESTSKVAAGNRDTRSSFTVTNFIDSPTVHRVLHSYTVAPNCPTHSRITVAIGVTSTNNKDKSRKKISRKASSSGGRVAFEGKANGKGRLYQENTREGVTI